jgi:cell division protein FtsB
MEKDKFQTFILSLILGVLMIAAITHGWYLRETYAVEEQQLNELKLHSSFLRGQVPEAKHPDRCGK